MNKQNPSVETIIRGRRTIHLFKPNKKPDDELIKSAIGLAQCAPNHHLTEPWHFYLIGPETAEQICLLNAEVVTEKKGEKAGQAKLKRWRQVPGWLLVSCDKSSDPITNQEDYAACCCAIQNLSLYLWQEGVGVKWTTGDVICDPRFYELVWINPDQEYSVGLLWYGYPKEIPEIRHSAIDKICVELP